MDNTTEIEVLETAEEAVELRTSILKLADASDELFKSGLSRRCILLLLSDLTKMSMRDVGKVLDALPRLRHFASTPKITFRGEILTGREVLADAKTSE